MSYEEVMEQAPNVNIFSVEFLKQFLNTVFSSYGLVVFSMALAAGLICFAGWRVITERPWSFLVYMKIFLVVFIVSFLVLNTSGTIGRTSSDVKDWESEYVEPYIKKNNKVSHEDIEDVQVQENKDGFTVTWDHDKHRLEGAQVAYEDIDSPYIDYFEIENDFTLSNAFTEYGKFKEGETKYPVIHLPITS